MVSLPMSTTTEPDSSLAMWRETEVCHVNLLTMENVLGLGFSWGKQERLPLPLQLDHAKVSETVLVIAKSYQT